MSTLLVGGYLPGSTWVHRLPVGPKLAFTCAFGGAVVLVRSMPASAAFLGLALVMALAARLPVGVLLRTGRAILLLAVVLSALQGWLDGWPKAVETFLDLLALVLMGVVLTTTTSVNAMLDALTRWLRRVPGVDADRVALTFGLAIQAIPGTVAVALETRAAARARGLRHPRAYLTPFVIRVVARAHETGDALHARGLGDDSAP